MQRLFSLSAKSLLYPRTFPLRINIYCTRNFMY